MNTTKTATTAPLTKKEVRILNDLAQAAENYRGALASLQSSIGREEAGLAAGHRTLGVSSQSLIEVASYHKVLETVLQACWYAYDMDGREWEGLVNKVYATTDRKWYQEGDRVEVEVKAAE